jgi:hypothetical protein
MWQLCVNERSDIFVFFFYNNFIARLIVFYFEILDEL